MLNLLFQTLSFPFSLSLNRLILAFRTIVPEHLQRLRAVEGKRLHVLMLSLIVTGIQILLRPLRALRIPFRRRHQIVVDYNGRQVLELMDIGTMSV